MNSVSVRRLRLIKPGIIFAVLAVISLGSGQSTKGITTAEVRARLETQFHQIRDAKMEIVMSISMPRFRMPRKRITVYYKARTEDQPSRMKIESLGFAAVPKNGLMISPSDIFDNLQQLSEPTSVVREGQSLLEIQGRIIPDSLSFKTWKNDAITDSLSVDGLSMHLWIDPQRWVIVRSETRLDTLTLMTLSTEHKELAENIYLPKKSTLRFSVGAVVLEQLDQEHGGPFSEQDTQPTTEKDTEIEGEITILFKRYEINHGLEDIQFEDQSSISDSGKIR